MNKVKIVNACIDVPNPQDYHYLEVFGVGELPEHVWHNRTPIFNQGNKNDPDTTYACTVYASSHCINEENAIEHSQCKLVNPTRKWKLALKRGANIKKGWSLQGAVNLAKDLGYISGYTLCRSLGEVKQALAQNQVIQTGSNQIDWKKTLENENVVVRGESYGHSFAITGYNDERKVLILRNSYGDKTFEFGHFFLKYEDFGLLYSCYSYADIGNMTMINLRDELLGQRAMTLDIWNGERGSDLCTRLECALMIVSAAKLENDDKIWNKQNKNMPVSLFELGVMMKKAFGTIPFVLTGTTRLKVAGALARLAK